MLKIYKYQPNDQGKILIPQGYKVLSVQLQNGHITLWAAVSLTKAKEFVSFYVKPTGAEVDAPELTKYVGTVQEGHGVGALVWHAFLG